MNDSLTNQIRDILREEYDRLDAGGQVVVQPEIVAAAAVQRLDPGSGAPTLLSWAAVLELRQMARSICRDISCMDDPSESAQGFLFAGELQRRYPAMRNGKEGYVLRENLTIAERDANSARLRAEAASKKAHADALDAETGDLLAKGFFEERRTSSD